MSNGSGIAHAERDSLWRQVVCHLRVWRQCVAMAFAREAEYRLHFALTIVNGTAQLALAVATFLLIYRHTETVAGWTRAEALILVGIYRVVEGLIALQITPNMRSIGGYIRRGEMDFYLLRPVSSQFLVSVHRLRLEECFNVLIGVGLTIYAGTMAGVRWEVSTIASAIAFLLCGLVLLYAVWFFTVTLAFWLVQVDTLDVLFFGFFEAARYPVSYFSGVIRAVLTFVIPVAFATTFPAEALLGSADRRLLPIGIVLALVALLGTRLFWNFAVRHYGSASS